MDPALGAASEALSRGDPLGALRFVALRRDAPALALRGVALAQLGEYATARKLLGQAGRAFRDVDPGAYARCLAAEGEVALECRDLSSAERALERAIPLLESSGDRENAWFCRLQLARRLVVLGRLAEAERALSRLRRRGLPPRMLVLLGLLSADVARRSTEPDVARAALDRAFGSAHAAGIPALLADVRAAREELETPVGRVVERGRERSVTLQDVADVLKSPALVVDTCRREIRAGKTILPLLRRPVLLALAAALGEAHPGEATRETLIQRAFGAARVTESLRARLRVELGRLRRLLGSLGDVNATEAGFVFVPRSDRAVVVLHPPVEGPRGTLLALLASGEPWSTQALAAALGTSARTVQRALLDLESEGKVRGLGAGRARKWALAELPGFATSLLLLAQVGRGVEG
ncbi:MAG TPA: HTH domain-containing protein [Polyangiaceae bacterium]|nr:HTH domain-containing protein [Polyangiaceae bacterium]